MKKTNLVLSLILAFNCVVSTPILAFITFQASRVTPFTPSRSNIGTGSQYFEGKKANARFKTIKPDEPTQLDKVAKQSKTFSILSLISLAISALTVLSFGMIIGAVCSLVFGLLALDKARTILNAAAPTIAQVQKAKRGRIIALIALGLLAIGAALLILFYLTFSL